MRLVDPTGNAGISASLGGLRDFFRRGNVSNQSDKTIWVSTKDTTGHQRLLPLPAGMDSSIFETVFPDYGASVGLYDVRDIDAVWARGMEYFTTYPPPGHATRTGVWKISGMQDARVVDAKEYLARTQGVCPPDGSLLVTLFATFFESENVPGFPSEWRNPKGIQTSGVQAP